MLAFRDLQCVYFKLELKLCKRQSRPGGNLNCLFVSVGLFAKFVWFSERLFFLNNAIFFLYKPLATQTLCFLGNLSTDWISLILSLFLYHLSYLFLTSPIIFLNNSLCYCVFLQFSMIYFPPLSIGISEGTYHNFHMQHFFVFEHTWQLKCQIAIVCFVINTFRWMVGRCINKWAVIAPECETVLKGQLCPAMQQAESNLLVCWTAGFLWSDPANPHSND